MTTRAHTAVLGESAAVDRLAVSVYTVPTEHPEADGTVSWNSTTMVLVEASAGDETGLGYSYTHRAAASLIEHTLADLVLGRSAFDVVGAWDAMLRGIRNLGRPGIASSAIAAVDIAIWDLKARLLGLPLVALMGAVRQETPVYGSGGFTSYSTRQLCQQLAGWVRQEIPRVKMRIGAEPREDIERVRAVRDAIGNGTELFVDASGAYDSKQALAFADVFAESGVSWFEEPVTSDDLDGLRILRDRAPPGMDITAGENGYDLWYFRRMLDAGAVDVLQADATRCAGITGFLRASTLCEAKSLPLSTSTAPTVHAHPACALPGLRHVEYFHDHVRIEQMFFDGALEPIHGALRPDRGRPGLGIMLKRADAARYAVR